MDSLLWFKQCLLFCSNHRHCHKRTFQICRPAKTLAFLILQGCLIYLGILVFPSPHLFLQTNPDGSILGVEFSKWKCNSQLFGCLWYHLPAPCLLPEAAMQNTASWGPWDPAFWLCMWYLLHIPCCDNATICEKLFCYLESDFTPRTTHRIRYY